MPQMYPLYWLFIYFMTLVVLLNFIINNYFNKMYTTNLKMNNFNKKYKFNIKW